MITRCAKCYNPVAKHGDMHQCRGGEYRFAVNVFQDHTHPFPCTCHPEDRPPECQHQSAASQCQSAWVYASQPQKSYQSYGVRGRASDEMTEPQVQTRGYTPYGLVLFTWVVGVTALAVFLAKELFETWYCL
jgi:hypothetical protein